VYHDSEGFDHPVRFTPLRTSRIRFQILWVPAHINTYAIREVVESLVGLTGRVHMCTRDYLPIGEGDGCQGTRFSVEVEGVWPEAIPERLTLDVKECTVLCTRDHVPGSVKVDTDLMVDMLSSVIDVGSIFVMGTLNKSFQWHVTLNEHATANHFVSLGKKVYRDAGGFNHPVHFTHLRTSRIRFQILWVPPVCHTRGGRQSSRF
jgi:hypothetical protein